jgi:hypothetical protein
VALRDAIREPGVIATWISDWKTLQVDVWVDNETTRSGLVDKLAAGGFKATVRQAPFSKRQYLSVRDAFAEARGINTQSDIDGRPRVKLVKDEGYVAAVTELLDSFANAGVEFRGSRYPGNDPRVHVVVPERDVARAQALIPKQLGHMVSVVAGGLSRKKQMAGPWAGGTAGQSGRNAPSTIVRGGKQVDTVGCSSGPVVRNGAGTDYATTAGHCFVDEGYTSVPVGQVVNISSAATTLLQACVVDWLPSCSPYTWGGVDAALLSLNSGTTALGWFVHQAWPGNQQVQTQSFTDQTIGSWDLTPGQHLICAEGASPSKFNSSAASAINAASSCGISIGWTDDGYYYLHNYPFQPICGGDSGAYVRRPVFNEPPFTSGLPTSYNAGIFVSGDDPDPETEPNDPLWVPGTDHNCIMRNNTSRQYEMYVTSYWKFHTWVWLTRFEAVWAKTW